MGIDIHNFEYRLERIEHGIKVSEISRKERGQIWQFRDQCLADGLGLARVVKYLQSIKRLYDLAPAGLSGARKTAIIALLAKIERYPWSPWTKHDYKLALKKYLVFLDRKDLTALIKIPKVHGYKLPEELITWEEIVGLISCTRSAHDRAFLYCLYESGCRIGEILGLQRKRVTFDTIGAVILVSGKTAMRRVRLIESAEVLDEWISERSFRPDQRIFPNTYRAYTKRIRVLAERAGIEKRIYPHLFRHSRATFLAGYLTEAQLCTYLGWTIGSAMPRIYVHLAGADLDGALMNVPSLSDYEGVRPRQTSSAQVSRIR